MMDRRTLSIMLINGFATSRLPVQARLKLNLRSVPAMSSWSMAHMRTVPVGPKSLDVFSVSA